MSCTRWLHTHTWSHSLAFRRHKGKKDVKIFGKNSSFFTCKKSHAHFWSLLFCRIVLLIKLEASTKQSSELFILSWSPFINWIKVNKLLSSYLEINKQKAFIQHIRTVFRFDSNVSFYPWWLRNRTFWTVYRNSSRILFLFQSHTRNEYSIKILGCCASQAFSICLLNSWICLSFRRTEQ